MGFPKLEAPNLTWTNNTGRDHTCAMCGGTIAKNHSGVMLIIKVTPFRDDNKVLYYHRDCWKAPNDVSEALEMYNTKPLANETLLQEMTKEDLNEKTLDGEIDYNNLTIMSFEIQNVKRVELVQLRLDGNTLVLGGNNAQGKSSVLDALWYAIGGGKVVPEEPLRKGTKKGFVSVDLGDITVSRHFTTKSPNGYLTLTRRDGRSVNKPQDLLDSFVSELSDPLAFTLMNAKDQSEQVRQVLGLDFTTLDKKREDSYDRRHIVGQEIKRLKGAVEKAEHYGDAPDHKESLIELTKELEESLKLSQDKREAEMYLDGLKDTRDRLASTVQELKLQLSKSEREMIDVTDNIKSAAVKIGAMPEPPDTESVKQRIAKAEESNAKFESNVRYKELHKELQDKEEDYGELTLTINNIDLEKRRMTAEAKFPIDGVSFDENGGLLYKDLPFNQASQAEQIETAIALSIAQNPKLKVRWIRQGALLDPQYLKKVVETANKYGVQLIIERVGNGDECTAVIEEGKIASPTTA